MGFKGTGIVPAIHQPLKLQLLFQRSSDGASTSNQLFSIQLLGGPCQLRKSNYGRNGAQWLSGSFRHQISAVRIQPTASFIYSQLD